MGNIDRKYGTTFYAYADERRTMRFWKKAPVDIFGRIVLDGCTLLYLVKKNVQSS